MLFRGAWVLVMLFQMKFIRCLFREDPANCEICVLIVQVFFWEFLFYFWQQKRKKVDIDFVNI